MNLAFITSNQRKFLFTWVKVTKDGSKPHFGVGHYCRNCTEHFLVAAKGKPGSFTKLGLRDIPNVIFSPRTEHSRKPEEFFTIANRLGEALGGKESSYLLERHGKDGMCGAMKFSPKTYQHRESGSRRQPMRYVSSICK